MEEFNKPKVRAGQDRCRVFLEDQQGSREEFCALFHCRNNAEVPAIDNRTGRKRGKGTICTLAGICSLVFGLEVANSLLSQALDSRVLAAGLVRVQPGFRVLEIESEFSWVMTEHDFVG